MTVEPIDMKKNEDEEFLPKKQKRLKAKQERKTEQRIKNILHDSRQASEIAKDVDEDDHWLE